MSKISSKVATTLAILMGLVIAIGSAQAVTISGSSGRSFEGECGDSLNITYASDNLSTLLTTAVIDVSTASSGTVYFKRFGTFCGNFIPPEVGFTGYNISTDGKRLILHFNNFNPGEKMQTFAAIRDVVTDLPVLGNEFAGSTFSATFTDSACTLSGTYNQIGTINNLANFSGTCEIKSILSHYRSLGSNPGVVETADLLKAADDWSGDITPPGFSSSINTPQLLALADEWAGSG